MRSMLYVLLALAASCGSEDDMPDRPSAPTNWANNPPGGSVTQPSAAQQASGWQPAGSSEYPQGKPVLQHANWIGQNLSAWEQWFAQVEYVPGDVFDDQFLPLSGTNPPSTGAGLAIAAGDFSAGGIIGGYRVPLTQSPAHTYSTNADTYWDLGRDGVWDANSVATGSPAPAVEADHIRAFSVTTDGSDRLTVNFDSTFSGITAGVESSAAQLNIDQPLGIRRGHLELVQDILNGATYTMVARKRSDVLGEPSLRLYISNGNGVIGNSGRPTMVLTVNAEWDQAGDQWQRDSDTQVARYFAWSEFGQHTLRHEVAMPATWLDRTTLDVANTWVPELVLGDELRFDAITVGQIGDGFRTSPSYLYNGATSPWRGTKMFDVTKARDGGGGSLFFGNPRVSVGGVFWQHTIADGSIGNVMFPLDLPHEATIVNVYVIYGGQTVSNVADASVWRRRIAGNPAESSWTRMQSGGAMDMPALAGLGELAISGLDTGLVINNREYQYGVWIEVDANEACTVYGIRVVYDYRVLTL